MVADAPIRTPLWQMTDGQLRFLVADDLTQWDRRKTAEMILLGRAPEQYSVKVEEEDGA